MTGLEVFFALLLFPIMLCPLILLIGHQATKKARYTHIENMFDRNEQAKRNAIIVEDARTTLVAKQTRALSATDEPDEPNIRPPWMDAVIVPTNIRPYDDRY